MVGGNKFVSIIIPTFNRIELLEFTLLSLYKQSIPADSFEVIVVDDCSTDKTLKVLSKMRPPFKLKVLHNEFNRGAAYSRNRGIKASKGEIIIFLDEMMVDKDFIRGHMSYHRKKKMVVTTTFSGRYIYTHCYPDFTKSHQKECEKISRSMHSSEHKSLKDAEKASNRTGKDKYKITKKDVLRLISPEQAVNHSALQYGLKAERLSQIYHALQDAYGLDLERMAAPWFMFVTNGISVSREMLNEVGLFDEKFKGAWLEDWELGYRLYKAGATFYNADDIICYHQNHPIGTNKNLRMENYLYFSEKFPDIEVLLVAALTIEPFKWSIERWGKIVTPFKEMEKIRGTVYREFIIAFRELAETLRWNVGRILNNQALPSLDSPERGFTRWNSTFVNKVKEQLEQLEKESLGSCCYYELVRGFKDLLCLPMMKDH